MQNDTRIRNSTTEHFRTLAFQLRVVAHCAVALWILVTAVGHALTAARLLITRTPVDVEFRVGLNWLAMRESTVRPDIVAPSDTGGPAVPSGYEPEGPSLTVTCTPGETGEGRVCDTCKFIPSALEDFLGRLGIRVPEWVCNLLFVLVICYVLMVIFDSVVKWVCQSDFITKPRPRCRRCNWWTLCLNKVACWFMKFIRWLMTVLCKLRTVLSWIVYAACVAAGLVVMFG